MRIPKPFNPRLQGQLIKRFGVYEKVVPVQTTPSRIVPDHIEKPYYVTGQEFTVPKVPEIKDVNQIRGMKRSCKLASNILGQVQHLVKPGISTDDIDKLVHNLTIEAGAYPSPLHYHGFPKSVCTSVNNVAVHGIPDLRLLQDGDIVNVDITVFYKGFHGDCSKTFLIGSVDDRGLELVGVTEECLEIAIRSCAPNVPFSEIGSQIYRHAKKCGLTVLPAFLGHGIGRYFHGPPNIYHIINDYPGYMQSGMTFTIEPVLSHGHENTVILEDGWTVVTDDGSRAAQAEHTVLITENGAEILTK
ncbi:methionine aminopeptidase 1D, mitochondrial isoform X2 [Plodia interpunctella]|uniref:methionine aminopeptidase 1D, mitochondrial isoform X2 n=1 Tax=Plodia interpunctella TaxID=58824 RepID=UPI0023677191|nr:methionine aminopeptidase 1D, mitochondrial isoform X2 [Plodia interpunctella]XP_053614453.1 methionine aminopeptidase 1D, mitochondrial isoform X2 [Plodia interpunctella]XP_053614461.1 methionine aminopeptidase 1D, mitochondrial isoform X2 [Plodia interpunctella]